MSAAALPAVVLGGTGYVAGELLRLIAGHPHLRLAAALSEGQPGEAVAGAFPHLGSAYPDTRFSTEAEVRAALTAVPRAALFCAAPHGAAAALLDRLLTCAEAGGCEVHAVDVSADYRFAAAADYQAVYGRAHGAPARLAEFTCALPEHLPRPRTRHVAHPGCFATAMLLAAAPLVARELIEPQLFVAGITGSTGSGRTPAPATHHPLRHGDLYSYGALAHRHQSEVVALLKALTGTEVALAFVPHSGPYARGIHVTLQARLRRPLTEPALHEVLADYYRGAPFVRVVPQPPRVKDVAGSNYAHLAGRVGGGSVALLCALDNLNKGAAGGALQWMNRLLGLPETCGLTAPAAGWT
ncbi:MAG: N-acetyl-gamma-glutamyl-phosphate reductase [Gammaproteobacteria bacterium]|nr:N-acetyl-gamma-glutamyl-phosphate reductase [Gammaproteobacteria bacterium]